MNAALDSCCIGVLIPTDKRETPTPPEELPIGRAALKLAAEGISIVCGDRLENGRMHGWSAVPGGWEPVQDAKILVLYDRFSTLAREKGFERVLANRTDVPLLNAPHATALCRDKLVCQRVLEEAGLAMPPVIADPSSFGKTLVRWGAAFVKPRYGSKGDGVRLLQANTDLPLREIAEPVVLQKAVVPPQGSAGISVRALVQLESGGKWIGSNPVARTSPSDPIVNAVRGAKVAPAVDVLPAKALSVCRRMALDVAQKLDEHLQPDALIELGVDFAIDEQWMPNLIEVNSRPMGRLEALAAADQTRFGAEHQRACERPLRYLAWRFGS